MKKTIISRTFKCARVNALKVDIENREVFEDSIVIDWKYDTVEKAEKYFAKHDNTVVSVISVDVLESLMGMYESDFIRIGKAYDERSKENRGMISKEVTFKYASVMVVDKERNVKDVIYMVDNEKDARKVCKENGEMFVKINHIEEHKQLICMDVLTFLENAIPMSDRFTLAK